MRIIFSLVLLLVSTLSASALDKTKLALNWKPEPEFGGFYAAQTSGAFAKHGLEVAIEPGGSGTPVVQMIAAGKVDFGIVSADEIVIARSHGADVVALFAAYQTNPQGIMAHQARGFKSIADVFKSDGTLALQKGLPYALYLLKKYGNPKVKIVPYAGGIANFLNDPKFSQQCFVTAEPLEAKKKNTAVSTFLVADEGYNPYTTVLAARGTWIQKNPKLAKEMVEAVRAGWREYLDHPEAANKVMAGLNSAMDMATFVESANAQKPLIETAETKKGQLGMMTEQRWEQLVQQLLDLKVIDKKQDARAMFATL